MKRVLSKILYLMNLGAFMCSSVIPQMVFAAENEVVGKVVSLTGKVMARVEKDEKEKYGKVEPRNLKPGDSIYKRDVINTASNSTVKVMFNDQSIMDIGQSSLFKVEQFDKGEKVEDRQVEFSMGYGKVRAAINQKVSATGKFKLKTKAATMGVRGTEFYVDAGNSSSMKVGKEAAKSDTPPAQMKVVVTEGKVEVEKAQAAGESFKKAPPPVFLNPGEKISVSEPVKSSDVAAAASSGASGAFKASEVTEMKVEKVSVAEMKSVTTEMKVKDTTFAQAITIEVDNKSEGKGNGDRGPASASGGGSAAASAFSGGGHDTLAMIKDVVAAKIEMSAPKPGDLSIPGAMGGAQIFTPVYHPPVQRTTASVTVVFHK